MKYPRIFGVVGLCFGLSAAGHLSRAWAQPPLPEERGAFAGQRPRALPGEESLKKARVHGKYAMLLQQIEVRDDAQTHADFDDFGIWQGTEWAGYKNLPPGYWVYVYPYWYIWRDLTTTAKPKRAFGPEQAVGPPDTTQVGHAPTAWASRTPGGQDEWLLLEYAEPITIKAIKLFESNNPGAVSRISVFTLQGVEVTAFAGQDPTPRGGGPGLVTIPAATAPKSNRIKLYLDSKREPGWNEIDAVGIVDEAGTTHWATSAEASTTAAQPSPPVAPEVAPGDFPGYVTPKGDRAKDTADMQARLERLEAELQQIKATLEVIQGQLRQPTPPSRHP